MGGLAALLALLAPGRNRMVGCGAGYFAPCDAIARDLVALLAGLSEGSDPT